jgi:hypothetical protein
MPRKFFVKSFFNGELYYSLRPDLTELTAVLKRNKKQTYYRMKRNRKQRYYRMKRNRKQRYYRRKKDKDQ